MAKITKETPIQDVLQFGDPEKITEVLFSFGMHCLGCALANHETIEDAAQVHGVDPQDIIDKLNAVIEK